MSANVLNMCVGIIGLLEAAASGPRTTAEMLHALGALGLEVTGPELYPWLRRLTEDGLLTPSLCIDTSGAQVRHYWISREGARELEKALPALRGLFEQGPKA